jgi:predicted adenine nucleotide alpha hydrolase (AANH) superfamily ATPase
MASITVTGRYRPKAKKFDRVCVTTNVQFSESDYVAATHFLRMIGSISQFEFVDKLKEKSPTSPAQSDWTYEYEIHPVDRFSND